MKILTLNSYSLVEEDYEDKLKIFVDEIIKEKPDIIALQEVNQFSKDDVADPGKSYVSCELSVEDVRESNHALRAARMLKEKGLIYHWTWLGMKVAWMGRLEGLSFLSLAPIEETDSILLSDTDDINNWRKRMSLGIKTNDMWFYNVHMGWWNDEEEPFRPQWQKLCAHVKDRGKVWIMGDFNTPANVVSEGYCLVKESGYFDSYELAKEKDDGITVPGKIVGWGEDSGAKRIDYIWSNYPEEVKSSKVMFKDGKKVSDHFGVMIEI